MSSTIKLKAEARTRWGGKQFIARITGRDPQFQLARKFCGKKGGKNNEYSFFETDEPGLYVTRNAGSGGSTTDTYHAVTRAADGLDDGTVSFEDALRIARRMDDGLSWDEIAVEEGWTDAPAVESSADEVPAHNWVAVLADVPTEALIAALAARGIAVSQ